MILATLSAARGGPVRRRAAPDRSAAPRARAAGSRASTSACTWSITLRASRTFASPAFVTAITRTRRSTLRGPALREAGLLERVDRRDHGRLVEPDQVGQLDLRAVLPEGRREHAVAPRREPERLERQRQLGGQRVLGATEEPAEVVAEALGRSGRSRVLRGASQLGRHATDASRRSDRRLEAHPPLARIRRHELEQARALGAYLVDRVGRVGGRRGEAVDRQRGDPVLPR